jgi:potassium-transporting ATPase ATP-binding subunit
MPTDTLVPPPPARPEAPTRRTHTPPQRAFDSAIVRAAIFQTFRKLTPRQMARAPILFVVYVGSILSTVLFLRDLPHSPASYNVFSALVVVFVWFVVLFGNFAEALAEGRGFSG